MQVQHTRLRLQLGLNFFDIRLGQQSPKIRFQECAILVVVRTIAVCDGQLTRHQGEVMNSPSLQIGRQGLQLR